MVTSMIERSPPRLLQDIYGKATGHPPTSATRFNRVSEPSQPKRD